MVSDPRRGTKVPGSSRVSIRFEVRGGFRLLSGVAYFLPVSPFQSALRFAVVSDLPRWVDSCFGLRVSIRFEVRGGFRLLGDGDWLGRPGFNPL